MKITNYQSVTTSTGRVEPRPLPLIEIVDDISELIISRLAGEIDATSTCDLFAAIGLTGVGIDWITGQQYWTKEEAAAAYRIRQRTRSTPCI